MLGTQRYTDRSRIKKAKIMPPLLSISWTKPKVNKLVSIVFPMAFFPIGFLFGFSYCCFPIVFPIVFSYCFLSDCFSYRVFLLCFSYFSYCFSYFVLVLFS